MKLLAEVLNLYRLHSNPEQLAGYDEQQKKIRNTGKWCDLWAMEGAEVRADSGTNNIYEYFINTNLVFAELQFEPFNMAEIEKWIPQIKDYFFRWGDPDNDEDVVEMDTAIREFYATLKQGQWKSFACGGVEYDLGIIVSEMDPETATMVYSAAVSEAQQDDE